LEEVGVNERGEKLYQITERGKKLHQSVIEVPLSSDDRKRFRMGAGLPIPKAVK
jgi:hypothetical protein